MKIAHKLIPFSELREPTQTLRTTSGEPDRGSTVRLEAPFRRKQR